MFLSLIVARSNVWPAGESKVYVRVLPLATVVLSIALFGQAADSTKLERQVQGQVLTSDHAPAVQITFAPQFKYAGGQRFLLYGVAEAEQHFYVQSNSSGQVERFYWVQFEHYLPDNTHQYDYPSKRTADIGGLKFIHDTAVFANYSGAIANPDSDGGKARALLKKAGFELPAAAARVRMVHLTDSSKRAELMIIYGEALEGKAPPNSEEGLAADDQLPELSARVRQHAVEGMKLARR
jgi:hypothetical protein